MCSHEGRIAVMLMDPFHKGQHSPRKAQSIGDKLAAFSFRSLARNLSDEETLFGSFISQRISIF